MKIHEYQAKQLLKQYGVAIPAEQMTSNFDKVVVTMLYPKKVPNA